LDFRDYLNVIIRRKWLVVLAVLAMVGVTLGLSYAQTPIYSATGQLLLQARASETIFGSDRNAGASLETEIQIVTSQPVRNLVIERIGAAPLVTASAVGSSSVIEVQGESTDAQQVAATVNTYMQAYIDYRRQQAIDDLTDATGQIQPRIDELQGQINALNAQILEAPPLQRPAVESQFRPELEAKLSQQSVLEGSLEELRIQTQLSTGGARIQLSATAPTQPIRPTPLRTGLLAFPVALVFGLALVFLFEYLDDSIKSKEDLERVVGGTAPVLGLIPEIEWKDRSKPQVVSALKATSPAAEAYRSLRTSVQFLGLDRQLGVLQVTSSVASEGKSTTLANLAVVMARTGAKVIVVDCDLRRPRIHHFFGVGNQVGLTSVVLGEVPLSAALQEVPGHEHLSVLASGPIPPDPSEFLASKRTTEILFSLRAQSSILLLDCSPVLPVTDATVLAPVADASLVVTKVGVTTRRQLHRTVEILNQVGAPLAGTVLNGVTSKSDVQLGYYYQPDERPTGRRARRNGQDAVVVPT